MSHQLSWAVRLTYHKKAVMSCHIRESGSQIGRNSVLTTDEKYFAILDFRFKQEKDLFSSVCEKCHTFFEGFSYFILLILITTELKV